MIFYVLSYSIAFILILVFYMGISFFEGSRFMKRCEVRLVRIIPRIIPSKITIITFVLGLFGVVLTSVFMDLTSKLTGVGQIR